MDKFAPFLFSLKSPASIRMAVSQQRLLWLLQKANIIKRPLNFMLMDWNLLKEDWEDHTPCFFSNQFYLLKWAVIVLYIQKYLNNLTLSNFFYKKLPLKKIIEVKKIRASQTSLPSQIINIIHAPDIETQQPYKLVLNIPLESEIPLNPDDYCDFLSQVTQHSITLEGGGILIDQNKLQEQILSSAKTFEHFLEFLHESIPQRLKEYFRNHLSKHIELLADTFGFPITDKAELMEDFTNVFENGCIYFALSSTIDKKQAEGIIYIPGKGFLVKDGEASEESGGGFYLEYNSDTYIEEESLLTLATLWFREYSIGDWAEKIANEEREKQKAKFRHDFLERLIPAWSHSQKFPLWVIRHSIQQARNNPQMMDYYLNEAQDFADIASELAEAVTLARQFTPGAALRTAQAEGGASILSSLRHSLYIVLRQLPRADYDHCVYKTLLYQLQSPRNAEAAKEAAINHFVSELIKNKTALQSCQDVDELRDFWNPLLKPVGFSLELYIAPEIQTYRFGVRETFSKVFNMLFIELLSNCVKYSEPLPGMTLVPVELNIDTCQQSWKIRDAQRIISGKEMIRITTGNPTRGKIFEGEGLRTLSLLARKALGGNFIKPVIQNNQCITQLYLPNYWETEK